MTVPEAPTTNQLASYGLRELSGHKRKTFTLGWSSSGRKLASGSQDSSVRVWSIEPFQGKAERSDVELKGHSGSVTHLAWKPGHDNVLASSTTGSNSDKTIRVWDVKSGKSSSSIPLSANCHNLTWSPDGSSLAALGSDNTLSIVDVRKAKVFKTHKLANEVYEIQWGPTNQQLMMTTDKGSVVIVGMPHLEMQLWSLRAHTDNCVCMATSKSYKYLASGGNDALVNLWDLETMSVCRTWSHMDAPLRSISISADNSMVAYSTGSQQVPGELQVVSVETGELLADFKPRCSFVESVVWNPVHNVLAYTDEMPDTSAPTGRDYRGPVYLGTICVYAPPKPS